MRMVFLVAITMSLNALSHAQEPERHLARVAHAAFECSVYAGMISKEDEHDRLFSLGYAAIKDFFELLENGALSDEYLSQHVPVGVSAVWNGPTTEFRIGRIYESISQYAYDNVVKEDENGLLKPVEKWITDTKLRESIAFDHYRKRNCEILS